MRTKALAALAALTLAIAAPAYAQDLPTRSMIMVIPFAAGGIAKWAVPIRASAVSVD
jgi:tripartite-type tricarboxylate transporter receptor subunit TctC